MNTPAIAIESYRGRLTNGPSIVQYLHAGHATLTLVSGATGTRYTYLFTRPKGEDVPGAQRMRPIWVKLLTGTDNENDYSWAGTIWTEEKTANLITLTYVHSKKSHLSAQAPGMVALAWLLRGLNKGLAGGGHDWLEQCQLWHEGRCGRCGRKLTVPASVASGYGPECITRV